MLFCLWYFLVYIRIGFVESLERNINTQYPLPKIYSLIVYLPRPPTHTNNIRSLDPPMVVTPLGSECMEALFRLYQRLKKKTNCCKHDESPGEVALMPTSMVGWLSFNAILDPRVTWDVTQYCVDCRWRKGTMSPGLLIWNDTWDL